MSSESAAIRVTGLGKRYSLVQTSQMGLRLGEVVSARLRRGASQKRVQPDEHWALRDVSFSVNQGEVLGLIGRNGAGKSTLLKVLSRITPPTEGEAEIRGRLGSLLEVGTGFHPELSGRENAYLNGAILGMKRSEVASRLGDIIDFSEMGRFIDTPVKRYSSGMYMRLAFSVAAYLETEVLLVDEVLAVGDIAFQQRCLGKMSELTKSGRSVVFVSHNLGAVAQLCESAVWLESGRIQGSGPIGDVVESYMQSMAVGDTGGAEWHAQTDTAAPLEITRVALQAPGTPPTRIVSCDVGLEVAIHIKVRERVSGATVAFLLRNSRGVIVVSSDVVHADRMAMERLAPGSHAFTIRMPPRLLAPDTYSISVIVRSVYHGEIAEAHDVCRVDIVDASTPSGARRAGVVGLNLEWLHEYEGDPRSGG